MRLHLKNISPEVHGLITQHKATHSHKNLDETVGCLIKTAMSNIDIVDERADLEKLIKHNLTTIDKLKEENELLRGENKELKDAIKNHVKLPGANFHV